MYQEVSYLLFQLGSFFILIFGVVQLRSLFSNYWRISWKATDVCLHSLLEIPLQVVDGKLSQTCYLMALDSCYKQFCHKWVEIRKYEYMTISIFLEFELLSAFSLSCWLLSQIREIRGETIFSIWCWLRCVSLPIQQGLLLLWPAADNDLSFLAFTYTFTFNIAACAEKLFPSFFQWLLEKCQV